MDSLGFLSQARDSDLRGASRLRGSDRCAAAEEATELLRARVLTPHEIAAHTGFHNRTVEGVGRLLSGFVRGGLDDIFATWHDDQRVREATWPLASDSDETADARSGYRAVYREAKREHALAARMASRLGPGVHLHENGDRVEVNADREIGTTTVVTRRHDGATTSVRFDAHEPNAIEVRTCHVDGGERVLSQHDLCVMVHERPPLGGGPDTITTWDLDHEGRPRRSFQ